MCLILFSYFSNFGIILFNKSNCWSCCSSCSWYERFLYEYCESSRWYESNSEMAYLLSFCPSSLFLDNYKDIYFPKNDCLLGYAIFLAFFLNCLLWNFLHLNNDDSWSTLNAYILDYFYCSWRSLKGKSNNGLAKWQSLNMKIYFKLVQSYQIIKFSI